MSRFVPALSAFALLALAACDGPDESRKAVDPQGELTTVASTGAGVILAPNGSMSLAVRDDGGPALLLSAGFLRRGRVAEVTLPVEVSWSPDSRRFLVNDGAGLRLWALDRHGTAVESAVAREAAITTLARRNGCGSLAPEAARTRGTAWGDDGRLVFVAVRGVSGPCAFDRVRELSVLVEIETGRLEGSGVTAP